MIAWQTPPSSTVLPAPSLQLNHSQLASPQTLSPIRALIIDSLCPDLANKSLQRLLVLFSPTPPKLTSSFFLSFFPFLLFLFNSLVFPFLGCLHYSSIYSFLYLFLSVLLYFFLVLSFFLSICSFCFIHLFFFTFIFPSLVTCIILPSDHFFTSILLYLSDCSFLLTFFLFFSNFLPSFLVCVVFCPSFLPFFSSFLPLSLS